MAESEQKDRDLKERIKWLIQYYRINDAAFAQKIQTNRSTLSQCLNGPNGIPPEYSTDLSTELLQPPTLFSENKDNAIRNPMAPSTVKSEAESRRIVKIMVFYSDNTFETYSLDKT